MIYTEEFTKRVYTKQNVSYDFLMIGLPENESESSIDDQAVKQFIIPAGRLTKQFLWMVQSQQCTNEEWLFLHDSIN